MFHVPQKIRRDRRAIGPAPVCRYTASRQKAVTPTTSTLTSTTFGVYDGMSLCHPHSIARICAGAHPCPYVPAANLRRHVRDPSILRLERWEARCAVLRADNYLFFRLKWLIQLSPMSRKREVMQHEIFGRKKMGAIRAARFQFADTVADAAVAMFCILESGVAERHKIDEPSVMLPFLLRPRSFA
jgi:hypothetical protein